MTFHIGLGATLDPGYTQEDIRTSWYMDIEIYLMPPLPATDPEIAIAALAACEQPPGGPPPGCTGPTVWRKYTYGPLLIQRAAPQTGKEITLKDFYRSVNSMLKNTANQNNWPEFRLNATPHLYGPDVGTDPGETGPQRFQTADWPPEPSIADWPRVRKLGQHGASAGNSDPPATRSDAQMFIQYDITMVDDPDLGENEAWQDDKIVDPEFEADDDPATTAMSLQNMSYYGFRIYWHQGTNEAMVPGDPEGPKAYVDFRQRPDTPLVALPHTLPKQAIIQDDLPLPPHIQFIPYEGVSNKLLIFMNPTTGVYDARPVPILQSDLSKLVDLFYNQKGEDTHVPSRWSSPEVLEAWLQTADFRDEAAALAYNNDDPVRKYEIFRITERPNSYRDFDTPLAPHATPTGNLSLNLTTDGVAYIDHIEPNTTYYYCIRAVDVHKNFSNPTYVFEVELVDNEGQVYPIVKPIVFRSGPQKTSMKVGRRFIYIEPSLPNLVMPDVNEYLDSSIWTTSSVPDSFVPASDKLGSDELHDEGGQVWETKLGVPGLKIRVTSKKTSKQFDINLTFKNTGVLTPEE